MVARCFKRFTVRIALVGADSSHADHYLRHINRDQLFPGVNIVAIAEAEPRRLEELAFEFGVPLTASSGSELPGGIDAVIVAHRDSVWHARVAETFLRRGLPVFVDKPLAPTLSAAEELIVTARASGAALGSHSALRWASQNVGWSGVGILDAVTASGPAQRGSPHGGLRFYGIHTIEAALALTDGDLTNVSASVTPWSVTVSASIGPTAITCVMVENSTGGEVPFTVAASSGGHVHRSQIALSPDYLLPVTAAAVEMFRSGEPTDSYAALRRPLIMLEAAERALQAGPVVPDPAPQKHVSM